MNTYYGIYLNATVNNDLIPADNNNTVFCINVLCKSQAHLFGFTRCLLGSKCHDLFHLNAFCCATINTKSKKNNRDRTGKRTDRILRSGRKQFLAFDNVWQCISAKVIPAMYGNL